MSGTTCENDPAWFELLPGDAALVVALLDHLAALAVRSRAWLSPMSGAFPCRHAERPEPHQMADRLSKLASVINAQLPADAPNPDA